ncbi:hypothetical protein AYO21_09390 [Fonsecaea monophora]|uniref:AAA+ ATPase domain-containing protein n=1 Tax=Fonsecaea monophora TaxID=254056 RepID=A0A177EWJ8_9EURO|nr:hypothetical protein AYO21_09390 [Fonsecaea monophora]KAH0834409.1 telomere length regulation protein [Fonsecaea pedrosoi]OAG36405.1 hypothetical protein AYO21_09390 [Fonsecaea monophora]
MATLLDYGAGPEHRSHMHPFFRKAAAPNDSSSQCPLPRIRGLDGAVEDDPPNNNEEQSCNPGNVIRTEATEAAPSGTWSVEEGDDLEHENTRIKRRRVSASSVHPLTETTETSHTNQMTWQDQLQAAAQTCDDIQPPHDCAEDQTVADRPSLSDNGSRIQLSQPTLSAEGCITSQRTTLDGRHSPNSSLNPAEIDLTKSPDRHHRPPDNTTDDHSTKESERGSPQRNKMMRSGHGKLIFSPKKSPKRASRSITTDTGGESGDAKKTARQSKKLEMKKGKLVSSLRITLSYSAPDSGSKINDILSHNSEKSRIQGPQAQGKLAPHHPVVSKATHPFFLGRLSGNSQKQSDLKSETSSVANPSEDETTSRSQAPKPWKDIIFESRRTVHNKNTPVLLPVWPPTNIQHVLPSHAPRGAATVWTLSLSRPKFKQHSLRVNADEDILWNFSRRLKQNVDVRPIHIPERKIMGSTELVRLIETLYGIDHQSKHQSASISRLGAVVESTRSSFDRGVAAGPQLWCHEYAPNCWQEVLEPQGKALYDWLSNLRVHQVQTGKLQPKAKPLTPKKRRKRKSEGMDDFIAYSDDEDTRSIANGKNAILLTGPPGSGKTASVFAVAQQLGFEVFEIHPGMRRSAKDIQDKVGDMTQNHLVQHQDTSSRRSSLSLEDSDAVFSTSRPLMDSQDSTANTMGRRKGGRQSKIGEVKETKETKSKSQKQSLVLFEEVDILYEEDKAFWSGVQSLIRTSKRPVILTCNSVDSVPMAELDLFAVLRYDIPQQDLAIQLLGSICAAEGHLLSKEVLQNLYLTKGQDLRASIMELNLWCQMTVGSQQGGLDWMLPFNDESQVMSDGSVTRIVSQDTVTNGLDLLPADFDDVEDLIRFSQDNLRIPAQDWVRDDMCSISTETNHGSALDDLLTLYEARSAMDLVDDTITPVVASALWKCSNPAAAAVSDHTFHRNEVVRLYLGNLNESTTLQSSMCEAFEPLLEESRIGLPSSPGRKAPSLDNPSAISLVTEVAPYIRYIVSHDQRLEQVRNELHGSSQQGIKRQRRTRAARAALEGGNKKTVRRDKWFPEELDWAAVMRTGNEWPQAREADTWDSSPAQTPSSSAGMEAGAEADEPALFNP